MARSTDPGGDPSATRWSRIQAGDFDYIVRRFWKPIRRFFANRLPSLDEAEDATQELFLAFLAREALGRADPEKGPFRRYLFQCARNFLIDRHRAQVAAKRGGGGRDVPLEAVGDPAAENVDLAAAFDQEWFRSLFDQALAVMKADAEKRGKPESYRAFHLYYFGDGSGEDWPQKRIASELRLPLTQIYNYIQRGRTRFGQELRAVIAEYAGSEQEIETDFASVAGFFESSASRRKSGGGEA